MATERIEFPGSHGVPLAARLDLPNDTPVAYALFAHCFTCSKDLLASSRIARALSAHGIGVLRFDFTGLGHSEGEFANTNFSSNIQDLVLAADWLRKNHQAPALLIGHSLGGAAVLAAADLIDESVAIATIGAPFDPEHSAELFEDHWEEIETVGQAEVSLAGRKFTIQRQFLDDIRSHKMHEKISSLKRALMIFHSPTDQTVGIENAAEIYDAANHPKSFVSLDGADHLLSKPEDAQFVANVLSAWASRYLPNAEQPAAESRESNKVVVEETGDGKFINRVSIRDHQMFADEPASVGGDDRGPSPYEFLLAGLGACTSMTLRMYAERKGIQLEQVKVSLNHSKIHARDCESCETKAGFLDQIEKTIELKGELTEAQRTRMMEIADRCPVHRTLNSEVSIRSKLRE